MTPKEKAEELVSDFYSINSKLIIVKNGYDMEDRYNLVMPVSKQCALIAVDEVQQLIKDLSSCKNRFIYIIDEMNYWQEVKQEIEKL